MMHFSRALKTKEYAKNILNEIFSTNLRKSIFFSLDFWVAIDFLSLCNVNSDLSSFSWAWQDIFVFTLAANRIHWVS